MVVEEEDGLGFVRAVGAGRMDFVRLRLECMGGLVAVLKGSFGALLA